jgi:hypothetical protein
MYTPWMLCHGMSQVDALVNLRSLVGNFQAKPCYQTAPVRPALPDAPVLFSAGAYASAAGYTHWRETLGLTTKMYIRFGANVGNSTGTGLGSGELSLSFVPDSCAKLVGQGRVEVNPGSMTTTDLSYFPIGDFVPAIGVDKVMAGFVVLDNEATYLEYQLVCRSAKDPRAPNAWQTVEAAYANPAAGNSERNTTALSLPAGAALSSNLLVQFGVAARKKSGAAGNPRAEIVPQIALSYL